MPAPVPVAVHRRQRALYVHFGVRVKARAYDAFLQGQFRESHVRYSTGEIEPLLAHAWIDLITDIADRT